MKKVKIELIDFDDYCDDGCCRNFGTITKVNGEELHINNSDVETILREVLIKLGFDAEVTHDYEKEETD